VALLVGTVIQSARVSLPDLPQTLPAPSVISVSPVNIAGSTLFSSQSPGYFVVVTNRNPWGETVASQEFGPIIVDGVSNNAVQATVFGQPGSTYVRAYITQPDAVAGSESQFVEQPVNGQLNQAVTVTISAPPTNAGYPPARSTAYNPDTDGEALSVGQMYTWLNEALTRLSRVVGGVLDYSGVGTVTGQPYYVVDGTWLSVPNVWYNGWWVQGADPGGFFKRNQVLTAILSRVAVSIFDDRCIFEVSYQPDRTAGATITTATMGSMDTFVTVQDPSQFLLTNGFCMIGTEICAYSGTNISPLSGLIRRLGGTSSQSWPSGTPVQELNLFFQGRRILEMNLQPGMALNQLYIPAGWLSLLTDYIIAKYRSAEQGYEEQRARLAEFDASCRDWAANKEVQKHVQVGGSRTPLTYNRTVAGGVIIP
jgi:hypothetical protein